MRQYPLIRKTLRNRYETVTLLGSTGSGNTYFLSGGIRNKQQYPLLKKTLRNRFKIVKLLGKGGSGDTYLAIDLDLPGQPYCVVKHFQPKDPNPNVVPIAKSLFAKEAEVLYHLGNDHYQIPRLFAHFDEDGDFYLVQEFIDGHDLTQEIIPGKRLGESAVFNLLKEILEVLIFVHKHKIIHRDIKPQNLMRRYSDRKIVLIDFGSIKKVTNLAGNLTIAVGTPGYMPSEQAKGKPKLCSDIYAVGVIGIQALTGLMPEQLQEDPNTGEIIWRDKVQVSDAFADVLDTMVRERYSQRYQSAAEALQALVSPPFLASSSPSPPFLSSSLPSPTENEDTDDSFLVYRKFILLLGVGLGTITSVVIMILIYTFIQASTSPPNQPTPIDNLIEKFLGAKLTLMNDQVAKSTVQKRSF